MSTVCSSRRKVLIGLSGLAAYSVAPGKVLASQSLVGPSVSENTLGGNAVDGNAVDDSTFSENVLGKRELEFYNIHTRERAQGSYWVEGLYQEDTLNNFDHLLRDHRQNIAAPMDKRLYELLFQLNKTLNVYQEFHVISGYRSPKTNQMLASKSSAVATKSYHMRGMAIDIAIPDVKLSHLREAAISLKLGGVGYYPKSGFIHVDTGRVRVW